MGVYFLFYQFRFVNFQNIALSRVYMYMFIVKCK